jgi:excisionase family DNA binding protein
MQTRTQAKEHATPDQTLLVLLAQTGDRTALEQLLRGSYAPLRRYITRAEIPLEQRLLIDRRKAAQYLSISQRSLDYLLANGELHTRRIGARVLIPISELQRYARADHPKPIAS